MLAAIFSAGLTLVGGAPCSPDAAALMATASALIASLDIAGAVDPLRQAAAQGCDEADLAVTYLGGLVAARQAALQGGAASALGPVRNAIATLALRSEERPGPAEIARLVLLAAQSAAQSEREEMAVFLIQATEMELLQRAAGQPGAPLVSALEAAGDLWMQVDRYADAERAYRVAAEHLGNTPAIAAGLARAAERLRATLPVPTPDPTPDPTLDPTPVPTPGPTPPP